MSLVEVKDLVFSYDQSKNAVDGVSFDLEKGSYTTIIGHNGSGKSTLAKLLVGLLEAKSGSIKVSGLEVNEENIYAIRDKIGIVFQNPDNQFIGSTVEDDIAFGLENHMVDQKDMQGIIEEYAKKTGIDGFLQKEPSNLSGGQKQRVAIAGALAMNPEIIIFDEATSMLDPRGRKEIKAIMSDLHKNKDLTIISITHDIEEVLQADNCIVMNKGKVFKHASPSEVFNDAGELRKIGLEIPFVLQVKEELHKNKIKVKSNDLEGVVEELCQLFSNR